MKANIRNEMVEGLAFSTTSAVIDTFPGIFPKELYPILHLEKAGLPILPASLMGDAAKDPESDRKPPPYHFAIAFPRPPQSKTFLFRMKGFREILLLVIYDGFNDQG
jgi:hypothetical protein